jgi:ATP-dependent DNA helicase RecG
MAVGWDTKLAGVVGRLAKELAKELGIETVGELLEHYPRRYIEMDKVSELGELVEGDLVMVVADVVGAAVHPYKDRRTGRMAFRTEVQARLSGGDIWATYFDRNKSAAEWRTDKLAPGTSVLMAGRFGKNSFKGNRWELTHPEIDEDLGRDAGLKPVYPLKGKITSIKVERAVRTVLEVLTDVADPLPAAVRADHDFVARETAIRWIHEPTDYKQVGAAQKRLRFDEAFVAQVALAQRRHEQRDVTATPRRGRDGGILDAFDQRMPFELTAGQKSVESDITADLGAEHPMHRLLQGEVGSGKTVVALRAMLRVVDSGAQAALLAPTEVLAQQHHRSLTALLGDLAGGGMLGGAEDATRVALLTGSLPAAARKAALLEAASGEAGIVVGTHALIQDAVQFADLGLVVVDEQHRFGVEQRAALADKATSGTPPHELVMTATPIPRTVAMTVFGDLETSALTELPAGRSPTQTTVVPLAEQPSWMDRVWTRVREEVEAGRQVYVVCPRISADDKAPASDDGLEEWLDEEPEAPSRKEARTLAAVEEVTPSLADGPLSGLRLESLHGRMPSETKDDVMRSFAAGEVDVLVATTVIEVGVDVPNASTIVILDADRYGLSQLHQLRGRVGRGGHAGLCLLVTGAEAGSLARERLDAVAATSDGFELAEKDLELRREGDVLGKAQSGNQRSLQLVRVLRDTEVIQQAREAAVAVVEADPELDSEPALRAAVAELHEEQRAAYLEKA